MTKDELFLLSEKYGGIENPEFFEDLKKLHDGVPVAYLIGFQPFLGTKIYLDSHPLIPRPETEYWVEKALANLAQNRSLHILDLCAGSGAIGVSALSHIPDSIVDFGEIDEAHFPTIQKNILENIGNTGRSKIIETNIWSNIKDVYDVVLVNPPYLSEDKIERVEQSVLLYEPRIALFAKESGYEFIKRIIEDLDQHLTKEGIAYIEHEPEQTDAIQKDAKKIGFFADTKKDQYGVLRYTILKRK